MRESPGVRFRREIGADERTVELDGYHTSTGSLGERVGASAVSFQIITRTDAQALAGLDKGRSLAERYEH